MIAFKLLFEHETIVYVIGTSFKMASTLSQKWSTIFGQKAENLYISYHAISFKFHQHVVQILIKWRDFRLQMSAYINGNSKYPIGKSIFAVNSPLNFSVLPLEMLTLKV